MYKAYDKQDVELLGAKITNHVAKWALDDPENILEPRVVLEALMQAHSSIHLIHGFTCPKEAPKPKPPTPDIVNELKLQASVIFIAVEAPVAQEIADTMIEAAEKIEKLTADIESIHEGHEMQCDPTPNDDKEGFIDYLKNTLIPDLEESGSLQMAEDFETLLSTWSNKGDNRVYY